MSERAPQLQTDEQLLKAFYGEADDGCFGDDIFTHYGAFAAEHPNWIEINDEALRLYNLLLDDDVEEDSNLDDMLGGIALGGWRAAFTLMARVLDVDSEQLEHAIAVAGEADGEGNLEPPIGISGLPERIELARAFFEALRNGTPDDQIPSSSPPRPRPEPPK